MTRKFGEQLAADRARAGLSQADLARRIGVDCSTVSRWEYGDRSPTRGAVLRIARGLRLSTRDRVRLMASAGFLDSEIPVDLVVALTGQSEIEQTVLRAMTLLAGAERRA